MLTASFVAFRLRFARSPKEATPTFLIKEEVTRPFSDMGYRHIQISEGLIGTGDRTYSSRIVRGVRSATLPNARAP